MRNTLASQAIPNYSRYIARAAWGEIKKTVKDQAVEQIFGVLGESILTMMIDAVDKTVDNGQSAQSFGSTAHKNLKDAVQRNSSILNNRIKSLGYILEAEVFFLDEDKRTDGNGSKRQKGSMGLDIIVTNTKTNKVVFGLDLKTGKAGTAKSKLSGYQKRLNNAPMVDIFVKRK
jgi:hypothetical protein